MKKTYRISLIDVNVMGSIPFLNAVISRLRNAILASSDKDSDIAIVSLPANVKGGHGKYLTGFIFKSEDMAKVATEYFGDPTKTFGIKEHTLFLLYGDVLDLINIKGYRKAVRIVAKQLETALKELNA